MNFWKAKIKIIIRWNVNERKWVFTTNSDFIIHISLQPVGVNLSYFKLRFDLIWWNRIHSLKYLRSTTLCCKDIGVRKLEIAAKTQFLSSNSFQAIPFKQFLSSNSFQSIRFKQFLSINSFQAIPFNQFLSINSSFEKFCVSFPTLICLKQKLHCFSV